MMKLSRPERRGNTWHPTSEQELLLRAALKPKAEALDAWQRWRARVNFDTMDDGSHRLLPLVYSNLRPDGIPQPLRKKMQQLYQRSWYQTQLKIHHAREALRALHLAQIPTMLLKAMALIPLYYPDPATRPMVDIDILVPTAQIRAAIQVLRQAEWKSRVERLDELHDRYLERYHAHPFHKQNRFELDLHSHVLAQDTRRNADDDFWANARLLSLDGEPCYALNATDQLLHVCVHASPFNRTPPIRWVADAVMVLRRAETDWVRLVEQARKHEVVLPLRNCLKYLNDADLTPIPEQTLETLFALPITREQKWRYALLLEPDLIGNTGLKFWYHYQQFRRLNELYAEDPWLLRFPAFLRDTWTLPSTRDVPAYMLRFTTNWFARRTKWTTKSVMKDQA